MEENKVIMTLEQYTNLILENNNLKRLVEGYKQKIESEIKGEMKIKFHSLSKEKVVGFLEETNHRHLLETFYYSWSLRDISKANFNIMTLEEIEKKALSIISKGLNERLERIIEEEKEQGE